MSSTMKAFSDTVAAIRAAAASSQPISIASLAPIQDASKAVAIQGESGFQIHLQVPTRPSGIGEILRGLSIMRQSAQAAAA